MIQALAFALLITAITPSPSPAASSPANQVRYCATLNAFAQEALGVDPVEEPAVYTAALFEASIAAAVNGDPTVTPTPSQIGKAAEDAINCFPCWCKEDLDVVYY